MRDQYDGFRLGIERILTKRLGEVRFKTQLAEEMGLAVAQLNRLLDNSWEQLDRETLFTLHKWLIAAGHGGLAATPFIVGHSLDNRLALHRRVLALIGNYPLGEDRTYVSSWDVRALSSLISDTFRQLEGRVEIDQASVSRGLSSVDTRARAEKGSWKQKCESDEFGCIVAIGAPHASAATEHLLCDMLGGQEPHVAATQEHAKKLGLYWHDFDKARSLPSAFTLSKAEAKSRSNEQLESGLNRLIVNGRAYDCTRTGVVYGAIVFQEAAAVIRIAAVGLTGPATEAAVRFLPRLKEEWLDNSRKQGLTGIIVIQAECTDGDTGPRADGDNRKLAFLKTDSVGPVMWI